MSIRHLMKAMKKSSGFLSIKIKRYWYPIEVVKMEFHKKDVIIYSSEKFAYAFSYILISDIRTNLSSKTDY